MMTVVNYVSSHIAKDLISLLTTSVHTDSCNSLYDAHNPDEIHNTYTYHSCDQAQISLEVNEICL